MGLIRKGRMKTFRRVDEKLLTALRAATGAGRSEDVRPSA